MPASSSEVIGKRSSPGSRPSIFIAALIGNRVGRKAEHIAAEREQLAVPAPRFGEVASIHRGR